VAVLATDRINDLALLQGTPTDLAATFRRGPVPLGEAVTVFGFPLVGALAATGNLTTGAVSALAGLANDPSRYQISAPIQPGNSGGAVLDESGLVIGVVVSKLDAASLQRAVGDIPQNINFAIKSSVAQNFLEANGVRITEKPPGPAKRVKDIAAEAVAFTVLLACFM
jgi:S1-C subfamily serine protease